MPDETKLGRRATDAAAVQVERLEVGTSRRSETSEAWIMEPTRKRKVGRSSR